MVRDTTLANLERVLRQNGHQLTAARRAILTALVRCGGHVSADDLVSLVRRSAPRVGRMTVYRTLELLSALGAIRPVYLGGAAAHYVLLEDGHHHHLICGGCQRVIEVSECGLEGLARQVSRRFDFQVQGHLLEFYGLCGDCQSGDAG